MTEPDDLSEGAAQELERAAEQLRARPTAMPVSLASRILQKALATPRPAQLVRAHPPHEFLRVSTTTLVALLRLRLDDGLDDAVLRRVLCQVDRDERLEEVTLELVVQYGASVPEVADRARALGREVLREALGEPAGGPEARVTVQHVHVGDVTVGDPRLVDPADEA